MSWKCRLIEYTKECNGQTLEVGNMFYFKPPANYKADFHDDDDGWYWPHFYAHEDKLSDYYKQHNSGRPPLLVFLPGRSLFCVDGACWRTPTPGGKIEYYGGWQVIGEAPLITLAPSINLVGSYHGFLQNGVISDDCEGRRFDQFGKLVSS